MPLDPELLEPELLDPELLCVDVDPLESAEELNADAPESPVVVVVAVEPTVPAAVALLVRPGSRPVTSTSAIMIQTATNTDTAPVTTRRRIVRTLAARAARASLARAAPAARAACGSGLLEGGVIGMVLCRVTATTASRPHIATT
jgi:hypothetical protein